MSVIVRNQYGAIAVNKSVIEHMLIEDMLGMDDLLILSDKKGRPIKEHPTPFIDPDYFDAVDVTDKKGELKVSIFIIVKSGKNISDTADRIFSRVEDDFELLGLGKPDAINVRIRGTARAEDEDISINRCSIDIVRNNV